VQQFGISLQELANATFKAQQDASLQGRQLNIAEAQNLAQNKLEADKTAAQKTIAEAENVAQAERLKTQISGQKDISALDRGVQEKQFNASLQQRLQEFLTQQTGNIYSIDKEGLAQAPPKDSTSTSISLQDLQLRKALGMSEASGVVYDPTTGDRTTAQTVQSQQANNQLFMQLASVLSGLTPAQQAALKGGTYTAPAAPVNGQISGRWKFNAAINDWEPYIE
jgi:hypothetical protein